MRWILPWALFLLLLAATSACRTPHGEVQNSLTKRLTEEEARNEAYGYIDRDLSKLDRIPESERVREERAVLTSVRAKQKKRFDKFYSRFQARDECWSYRTYVVENRGGQTGLARVRKGRVKETLPLLIID